MTQRGIGWRKRLMIWVLAGVGLDAAVLIGIWLLLDAAGPFKTTAEFWLDALGLTAAPWLVHVIALREGVRITWIRAGRLLARTAAFFGLAALIIPALGVFFFFSIGMSIFGILAHMEGGSRLIAMTPPSWIDGAIGSGVWIIIATMVGAVIGLVLHELRLDGVAERLPLPLPSHPRMRSDVLGGAIAAFLVFSGMLIASSLGLFTQPTAIPGDWMHQFARVPQLSATLLVGLVALLPHLLMVGMDLFGPDMASRLPPSEP